MAMLPNYYYFVPKVKWMDGAAVVTLEDHSDADVVEVVRCRECKYTETDCVDNIHCQKWDRWEMPPDGYCALGQRREDGDA